MEKETIKKHKKKFTGVVVSDSMDKTIVVKVNRFVKHPKYKKFYNKSKKFHAHDENGIAHVGDKVTIVESKPYSKTKKFEVISNEE